MKVLLLSAYDTPSHRYWCMGLQRHLPGIDWTYLNLPGRYFSWRIRGNGLTWSVRERELLRQAYDLVLATSMTDLATLRGLCPALAVVPSILYFHENQFAYPQSALAHASVEPQMVTLYAALCADKLVFNSNYNRQTFLSGVAQLLRKLPDEIPPGIVQSLTDKASTLPVPLEAPTGDVPHAMQRQLPLEIIWNHRWEHDKGPRKLLDYLRSLPLERNLRLHIVGQQFRHQPSEFELIHRLLIRRGWLGQWGYVRERHAYVQLLQHGHAVLSTADHDFQGLAVLEAVVAGCVPLVPRRLAYPEWFGEANCYAEGGQTGASLPERIVQLENSLTQGAATSTLADISNLYWPALLPRYRELLYEVGKR